MKPLFVYLVEDTDWHVIVTDDAGHFYFNSRTKASVWQSADVEPNVVEKINYDEVAVLFAKARGLDVREVREVGEKDKKEGGERKAEEMEDDDEDEVDGDEEVECDYVEVEGEDETMALLREVMAEHDVDIENEVDVTENVEENVEDTEVPKESLGGLSLGYSSDESDESDEEELDNGVGAKDVDSEEESGDVADADSNAGSNADFHGESGESQDSLSDASASDNPLDLSLDTENDPAAIEAFKALLDTHKSSFSIYDPWFMVEEDLLAKAANDPAYYGVPEAQRESIFNAWVSEASTARETAATYPTSELLFFQLLQDNKSDVKTLYYSEYLSAHSEVANFLADHPNLNAEVLYRQLRVTLNDFARHEREVKKQQKITGKGNAAGNLKVAHLDRFLHTHQRELPHNGSVVPAGSAFEHWIDILNCGVPIAVAHDTINFIVGDEKRVTCYRRAMAGPDD